MESGKEENTFEDPILAQEWINSIESEWGRSREKEIYPLLYKWSQDPQIKIIVEIGAGQGVCSSKIDLSSAKYIGIDPAPVLIKRAKELYPELNKEFLLATTYAIPLPDQVADAVFSVGVWFHLKNPDQAHQEISRILKPGGKSLIITANPDFYEIWKSFFTDYKIEGEKLEGHFGYPNKKLSRNIFYLHSEQEIINSLINQQLSITAIEKFGYGSKEDPHGPIWIAIKGTKS